jgi:L-lactate dehydrogenase complex protein LldG
MDSRQRILLAVKENQPGIKQSLPALSFGCYISDIPGTFIDVLKSVGGGVYVIRNISEIDPILKRQHPLLKKIISVSDEFAAFAVTYTGQDNPHLLADVDIAIINAHLGVAENGAVWVTEEIIIERVLPFICAHLAVVIDKRNLVATMHDAYDRIGLLQYDFGTFISGPSKTADIEQSLVLGAHGPKSMTVFIID